MNIMTQQVDAVIETNLHWFNSFDRARDKRVFQFIKYVTGKSKSTINDYNFGLGPDHYGYETITLEGQKGFIRLSLKPLFQII